MSFRNALVVSPELPVQQALATALSKQGLATIVSPTAAEAEDVLSRTSVSAVFCSDELPGTDIDRLIGHVSHTNKAPFVIVSRSDDWGSFLHFLQRGAFDYAVFPLDEREIDRILRCALSAARLLNQGNLRSDVQVLASGA